MSLQLILLFFKGGVIQLTFAHRLLKVKTNAVWFPEATYVTDMLVNSDNPANYMIFEEIDLSFFHQSDL